MVVCMKSVQVWCQSLRNKISFSFIFLSLSRSSKLHEADCLAWPPPQKRCAKKLISVANLGFCKICRFDIDLDSKMPSNGCKMPVVKKGQMHQKRWIQSRTTNVKIQILLNQTIWMQNHIFNISLYYLQMLAPISRDASDYLLICSGILAAFSYLGLPTHGLGTRLKVDNIEFTLVMTMVTMVILTRKERIPDQLEDI